MGEKRYHLTENQLRWVCLIAYQDGTLEVFEELDRNPDWGEQEWAGYLARQQAVREERQSRERNH